MDSIDKIADNYIKRKCIFFGSGKFAVPILQTLLNLKYLEIILVVTQPDKPGRRGLKLIETPVSECINSNHLDLELFKPIILKNEYENIIKKYTCDLVLVCDYGQIIPKRLIDFPKYGSINIHPSLLPELRGATPIQMAILRGLNETGVTIQKIVQKMDAGDILFQKKLFLDDSINSEILADKLSIMASNMILEFLPIYFENKISGELQNESRASYCYESDVSKDKAQIFFDTDIGLAYRMVRAFRLFPVAWFVYKHKTIKIFDCKIYSTNKNNNLSDFLVKRQGNHLLLYLKNGILELLDLQMEGKKRMSYKDYYFLDKF